MLQNFARSKLRTTISGIDRTLHELLRRVCAGLNFTRLKRFFKK